MSDVALVAIMVASFAFAIGLVRVLDRMIDRDRDPGMADDESADEPPDTSPPGVPGSPR
jgi:hypothetical protein